MVKIFSNHFLAVISGLILYVCASMYLINDSGNNVPLNNIVKEYVEYIFTHLAISPLGVFLQPLCEVKNRNLASNCTTI